MELGYALARRRRVVLSARKDTRLDFDHDKLPTYMWDVSESDDVRRTAYCAWLDRYSELPPIVESLKI